MGPFGGEIINFAIECETMQRRKRVLRIASNPGIVAIQSQAALSHTVHEGKLPEELIWLHSKSIRNLLKNFQSGLPFSIFQSGEVRTLHLSMIGKDLL
jgi:hypothetical protein